MDEETGKEVWLMCVTRAHIYCWLIRNDEVLGKKAEDYVKKDLEEDGQSAESISKYFRMVKNAPRYGYSHFWKEPESDDEAKQ